MTSGSACVCTLDLVRSHLFLSRPTCVREWRRPGVDEVPFGPEFSTAGKLDSEPLELYTLLLEEAGTVVGGNKVRSNGPVATQGWRAHGGRAREGGLKVPKEGHCIHVR